MTQRIIIFQLKNKSKDSIMIHLKYIYHIAMIIIICLEMTLKSFIYYLSTLSLCKVFVTFSSLLFIWLGWLITFQESSKFDSTSPCLLNSV